MNEITSRLFVCENEDNCMTSLNSPNVFRIFKPRLLISPIFTQIFLLHFYVLFGKPAIGHARLFVYVITVYIIEVYIV